MQAKIARTRTIRELSELIDALDRRLPQVEKIGEVSIARSAAALRDEAVRRLADLQREEAAAATSVPPVSPAR